MKIGAFDAMLNRLRDSLQDSPLIIELRSQFSNLDPKVQRIVSLSVAGVLALIILSIPLGLAFSTGSLKSEIRQLDEDTAFLRRIDRERRELQLQIKAQQAETMPSINPNASAQEIAERSIQQGPLKEGTYEINAEADAANMSLAQISLRQLVRVIYSIETAGALVEQLEVDTRSDPRGYLWATLRFRKGQ